MTTTRFRNSGQNEDDELDSRVRSSYRKENRRGRSYWTDLINPVKQMSLCKSGQILNCCHPNALMTLSEYLEDYASEETKRIGYELIERELQKIPKEKVRQIARQNIEAIRASNRRDFRF